MKKILNLLVTALLGAVLLVSCKDDDTTGLSLYGFNPNPAVRGETITFYGEGLGAITSVLFQGGAETAEITRGESSISVVIPMDARPGFIELKFAGGSYVTRSELTLEEPLENGAELFTYTDFTDKTNAVTVVGGKVYIVTKKQTDYLSDIVRVEFEGENAKMRYDADAIASAGGEEATTDAELVALSEKVDFVRGAHLVIVTIPEGARSGAVNLYNSSDDRFEAQEVQIAQSAAQGVTPDEGIIPGYTRLTVTGENFGLVTSIVFTGGVEVTPDEIDADENPLLEIAADGRSLTVMTKQGMQDGPLALQTKSGEVIATPEVTTVVPANLSSWTQNDLYKAGKNMTLSCNDTGDAEIDYRILTQIEKVYFYKADGSPIETSFEASGEYKCLNVIVPSEAIDGNIGIVTHAGKEAVAVEGLTLVKAAVTGCDTEVAGGEKFTVTGTDLDLIVSVRLGDTDCTFIPDSDGVTLEVATERTYQSGKVTLRQANGLELTAAELLEILAVGDITVTSMPVQAMPGEEITVEGQNFNMVESIYIGDVKVTSYTSRSDTSLTFLVPADVPAGAYPLTFNLAKGTTETSAQTLTISQTQSVTETLWEGSFDTASWAAQPVEASKFAALPADAVFTLTFDTPAESGAQLSFKNGADWSSLISATPDDPQWGCYTIQPGETSYEFRLDAADMAAVQANGMLLSGQKVVVRKLTATYSGGGSDAGSKIWEGSFDIGNWSANLELAASLFADVKAGDKLRINYEAYTSGSDTWYQLAISAMSDGWPALSDTGQFDVTVDSTMIEFTVTEAQASEMKSYGIALKGHTLIIKSVEIIR